MTAEKCVHRIGWLILTMVLLCCMATGAIGEADLRSYRTAAYFERGYSAYAFAKETAANQFVVEVYLQYVPGYIAEAPIDGYKLYLDGVAVEGILKASGTEAAQEAATHFAAKAEIAAGVKTIALVPQTQAGEFADETVTLYDASAGESAFQTAVVNNPVPTDKLNLRIAPSGQGDSLRQYYNGVQVDVLGTMAGDWVAVNIGKDGGAARGYMKSDYLAFGEDGAAVESAVPSYEAIVASWTLYSYPDEASEPVAEFGKGQAFEVLGRSSSWWHIAVDDVTGFVRADILIVEEAATEAPVATTEGTSAAPQQSQTSTSASDGKYAAARDEENGYSIKATVDKGANNQYTVTVNVQYNPETMAEEDTVSRFMLYINGKEQASVPLEWSMETADGPAAGYKVVTTIEAQIEAVQLVPVWSKGGEKVEEALDMLAK